MNHPLQTKADLKYYLECDRIALGKKRRRPSLRMGDRIWRFEILMRKCEYLFNRKRQNPAYILPYYWFKWHFNRQCVLHNIEMPMNVIGEGLVIWHLQNIIINANAHIGKNLSLSAGVTVGQAHDRIPEIGDNVELMLDARVLGVTVCDHVVVGAGALVVKPITEPYTVWAGLPAKRLSNHYREANLAREQAVSKVPRPR